MSVNKKTNKGEIILQIPLALCPTQHCEVTNKDNTRPQGCHGPIVRTLDILI
jgi:hypothetical protein